MSEPNRGIQTGTSSQVRRGYSLGTHTSHHVELRRFPFPFQAGLAVCSDIDGTTSLERFLAIQAFLNCDGETSMGTGLGLEIGNSFFPYTPDDSFAFFSSRPAERRVLETLMRSGHVDCIHSFGDGAETRADALRALEALEQSGCKLDVWVDHSRAPSNFGKDTSPGLGDVVGSAIYHADVTLAYGIKYVWKGRSSSIVGLGIPFRPASFLRIVDRAHFRQTLANLARELAKTMLAYLGNRRFAVHRHNRLLHTTNLQDGQPIVEFNRCNNHWRGLSYGHDSHGLAYVLRPRALRDLIASQGTMVIYTHLGVGPEKPPYIPSGTQDALRNLAGMHREGLIYVTTTSRLINYHHTHRNLCWSFTSEAQGRVRIDVHGIEDPIHGPMQPRPETLQGITFYVPDRNRARVFLDGTEIGRLTKNTADHTGRESVMVPRTFLEYPLPANGHSE